MRWLALVLLFGCGDNLAGISASAHQEAETAARCQQLTRCGLFSDEGTCIAFARRSNETALLQAVTQGTIKYNAIAEQTCVNELSQISCDTTARDSRIPPINCQGAFLGTLAPGSACGFDEECSSARCMKPGCEPDQCCVGTCQPAKHPTGTCSVNSDCVDTTYCSPQHECKPLEKLGADCANDAACDFGLACIGASSVQPGTCRKLPRIGESCPYGRCADIGARCDASGKCVAVGLPNHPCTMDSECSPYAQCTANACADVPSLGEPCVLRCAGEAYCNSTSGLCEAPLENGALCKTNNDCASRLCVEGPIYFSCVPAPVCL